MPKLKEILSNFQDASLYVRGAEEYDKLIDQAFSEIKSLIKEKLPKKLDMWFPCTGNNEERKFYKEGFNSCLTEIEKIVEELE